jgi:hypothetical protein
MSVSCRQYEDDDTVFLRIEVVSDRLCPSEAESMRVMLNATAESEGGGYQKAG